MKPSISTGSSQLAIFDYRRVASFSLQQSVPKLQPELSQLTSRSTCSDAQSSVAIRISQGFLKAVPIFLFKDGCNMSKCPTQPVDMPNVHLDSGHCQGVASEDSVSIVFLRPVEIWSSPVVWVFVSFYSPLCVDCHQVGKGQIFEVHSFTRSSQSPAATNTELCLWRTHTPGTYFEQLCESLFSCFRPNNIVIPGCLSKLYMLTTWKLIICNLVLQRDKHTWCSICGGFTCEKYERVNRDH